MIIVLISPTSELYLTTFLRLNIILLVDFQYVTYKTKLKTNKYCLISKYTSLESLFHFLKRGLCLIGIKEHLLKKKKLSVLIRRLCIWL